MKKDPTKVYATHGDKEQLLGVKAKINGVLSIAYMKGDKVISYEPWEDLQRQMFTGPCLEIKTFPA